MFSCDPRRGTADALRSLGQTLPKNLASARSKEAGELNRRQDQNHLGFLYAEGVASRSPGSRRGKAAERTLGCVSHNTRIRRRRYTNDDNDNPTPTRSRDGTTTFPLCNAFGVWDAWGLQSPRVRRERRFRRIAATLGFGM
jgi:hypothetical protein